MPTWNLSHCEEAPNTTGEDGSEEGSDHSILEAGHLPGEAPTYHDSIGHTWVAITRHLKESVNMVSSAGQKQLAKPISQWQEEEERNPEDVSQDDWRGYTPLYAEMYSICYCYTKYPRPSLQDITDEVCTSARLFEMV